MIVKLLRGNPATEILTAPAAVVPGQLVAFGNAVFVAVNRAASGAKAAFAVGGGVYQMTASETGGEEPVAGSPAYFDSGNDVVSDGTSGDKHLGIALSVDSDACVVYHQPNGSAVA